MHTQQLLLSCLLFLNEGIGFKVQRINEHCVLINSGSTIDICNRVLHTGVPTYDEIALIKKQFAGLPFSWPMNPDDEESSQLLKEHVLLMLVITLPWRLILLMCHPPVMAIVFM